MKANKVAGQIQICFVAPRRAKQMKRILKGTKVKEQEAKKTEMYLKNRNKLSQRRFRRPSLIWTDVVKRAMVQQKAPAKGKKDGVKSVANLLMKNIDCTTLKKGVLALHNY